MGARWSVDGSSGEARRVVVQGELDLAVEQAFVDEIDALFEQQPEPAIVVDLAAVEFIDSSGVRALVRLRRAHGDLVRFEQLSPPVRKVLEIAGLIDHLGIDPGGRG